ncbi:hypothetical protein NDU88_008934 [Pleurodeles waltl]|uniref:Uncharacterized protein n=1 Tax=Pleurodeles waltl TaxID=8319 RepID=A0AAV7PQR5_PLEWA|nr:hypothetical protein NDU88_008934 [Pleurodeles waltl]
MPGGRSSTKNSGKLASQLLFSEALLTSKASYSPLMAQLPVQYHNTLGTAQESTMDRIVQEISGVGRRLEGMDNAMASLTAEAKFIRLDIAGFQSHVQGLEQRVSLVEAHAASSQELLYLRSKVTDLKDRRFAEAIEGDDMHLFLRETLPRLTGITFDPPLEFQRAHRLGLKRPNGSARPRAIRACFLRHTQARQIIERARAYRSCQMDGQEIWITGDFSKDTSECRRAFLALRPRQMEVKYGLFDPARIWVMKNVLSQDFYDPEDLRFFLDGLQSMDTSASLLH